MKQGFHPISFIRGDHRITVSEVHRLRSLMAKAKELQDPDRKPLGQVTGQELLKLNRAAAVLSERMVRKVAADLPRSDESELRELKVSEQVIKCAAEDLREVSDFSSLQFGPGPLVKAISYSIGTVVDGLLAYAVDSAQARGIFIIGLIGLGYKAISNFREWGKGLIEDAREVRGNIELYLLNASDNE